MHAQKVFKTLIWRVWMLQIQNKLIFERVDRNIFFPDKIYFGKRLFYIDVVTNYDHVFDLWRVLFLLIKIYPE